MTAARCARCGSTTADRAYIAFTGDTTECYCLYCLDERELGMALDVITLSTIIEGQAAPPL